MLVELAELSLSNPIITYVEWLNPIESDVQRRKGCAFSTRRYLKYSCYLLKYILVVNFPGVRRYWSFHIHLILVLNQKGSLL